MPQFGPEVTSGGLEWLNGLEQAETNKLSHL